MILLSVKFLNPLNIPTPTPAPNRGGPVACVGGPVAWFHKRAARYWARVKGVDAQLHHLEIPKNMDLDKEIIGESYEIIGKV